MSDDSRKCLSPCPLWRGAMVPLRDSDLRKWGRTMVYGTVQVSGTTPVLAMDEVDGMLVDPMVAVTRELAAAVRELAGAVRGITNLEAAPVPRSLPVVGDET